MTYQPALNAGPTDLEAKAGVESLEVLHAERRTIIAKLAPLEILFGSGGDRWTAKRRQHRDTIAKILMDEQPSLAIGKIEILANADERHVKFCEETEGKYIEYLKEKTALSEVEERIENRKAELYFAGKEAGLQ